MKTIYSPEDLSKIDLNRVPHHVAIIMDGNRRWARQHGLPAIAGHWKGAETLHHIVDAASALGIKVLTVYAFSTENWGRESEEVQGLMELLKHYFVSKKESMKVEGVRLQSIGDVQKMPLDVQQVLAETKEATSAGRVIDLVLALNYGGRDDLRRAFVSMLRDCEQGKLLREEISEAIIARYLDTAAWPDPEILIRTSGERRQSNFLLWQLSYSEFYHTEILWPDFNAVTLLEVIQEYQKRNRRLGA